MILNPVLYALTLYKYKPNLKTWILLIGLFKVAATMAKWLSKIYHGGPERETYSERNTILQTIDKSHWFTEIFFIAISLFFFKFQALIRLHMQLCAFQPFSNHPRLLQIANWKHLLPGWTSMDIYLMLPSCTQFPSFWFICQWVSFLDMWFFRNIPRCP